MEKKINRFGLIIIFFHLVTLSITSQELLTRKNLVSSSATISPGFQKNNPDMNIYVHGFIFYHPEPRVSLNGEGYWYTGAQEQQTLMAENSTLLFGPNYHLTADGKVDPFVGIMPAISLVSAVDRITSSIPSAGKLSVVPLISFNAGFRLHFVRWFNAFLNVRYFMGTLTENYPTALSLNELRVSFGLGFNLYSKNHFSLK